MCRPREAAQFCARRAPSLTCLCDPTQAAYTAYGLRHGSPLELVGPETIAAGVRATLAGHMQGAPVGDPRMMPGTFAIDAGGIIRAVHYARHPGDQPDLAALIGVVRVTG